MPPNLGHEKGQVLTSLQRAPAALGALEDGRGIYWGRWHLLPQCPRCHAVCALVSGVPLLGAPQDPLSMRRQLWGSQTSACLCMPLTPGF